jgi:hypothetical protein
LHQKKKKQKQIKTQDPEGQRDYEEAISKAVHRAEETI